MSLYMFTVIWFGAGFITFVAIMFMEYLSGRPIRLGEFLFYMFGTTVCGILSMVLILIFIAEELVNSDRIIFQRKVDKD